MKMKKLSTALLVLMGVVLLGTSSAQAIPNGSLILAFRLNNTGGTGTDLEVNLGLASSFNFASNQSSLASLNTDLTNIYGSNWNTNSNLVFSIIGESNSPSNNKPIYLSNPGNANTPFTTSSTSSIVGFVNGIYSVSGSAGNAAGSLVVPETNTNSLSWAPVFDHFK